MIIKLKDTLAGFIIKRVLILFGILVLLDLIFLNQRGYVLAGLLLGTAFGILKLNSTLSMLKNVLPKGESSQAVRRSLRNYLIGNLGTAVVLIAAVITNLWFFAGTVVGLLLVTLTILINSITEVLHITHNNFGDN
ncbi:MAG: hypothetical protein HGA49_08975 [Eubacteriaceae bacterium]|nr:hypothetical protein [Eubacteriaceae bacterium]